jgi:hypothetical protein
MRESLPVVTEFPVAPTRLIPAECPKTWNIDKGAPVFKTRKSIKDLKDQFVVRHAFISIAK